MRLNHLQDSVLLTQRGVNQEDRVSNRKSWHIHTSQRVDITTRYPFKQSPWKRGVPADRELLGTATSKLIIYAYNFASKHRVTRIRESPCWHNVSGTDKIISTGGNAYSRVWGHKWRGSHRKEKGDAVGTPKAKRSTSLLRKWLHQRWVKLPFQTTSREKV